MVAMFYRQSSIRPSKHDADSADEWTPERLRAEHAAANEEYYLLNFSVSRTLYIFRRVLLPPRYVRPGSLTI